MSFVEHPQVSKKSYRSTRSGDVEIPQGNTTRGVNRIIFEFLQRQAPRRNWKSLLDIPCGHGLFVSTVQRYLPLKAVGADIIAAPAHLTGADYLTINAADPPATPRDADHRQYDVITCISGIMEFGNTQRFVDFCHAKLNDGGVFILTNDSVFTIEDRMLYALLGRTRRLKLFRTRNRSVWNLMPLTTVIGTLHSAGFQVDDIVHVMGKPLDYWMLPLALLAYPLLYAYVRFSSFFEKSDISAKLKSLMFPLRSLYCTHYIVFCSKVRSED